MVGRGGTREVAVWGRVGATPEAKRRQLHRGGACYPAVWGFSRLRYVASSIGLKTKSKDNG